jgi:hypothetical protein
MTWPDLTVDQQAYRVARMELGGGVTLSVLLRRAQEIKEGILAGTIKVWEVTCEVSNR